ncbi:unnamed protein product [Strongylus vulgaris]|uniref:Uncharacterized protein n=1 Tax=Strongylus vulgaris TaxID=40348 RepID=A0A3P7LAT2_STRVU|nr:unnamed protein product [Strongylus vulgaris]
MSEQIEFLQELGKKAREMPPEQQEKMSDTGKALKDAAEVGYDTNNPEEDVKSVLDNMAEKLTEVKKGVRSLLLSYENDAKESASSAMDATKSGKGTYPTSNLGQTEENIRETTERKLDHLEKMAKKKV